jgi:hypothetical protein
MNNSAQNMPGIMPSLSDFDSLPTTVGTLAGVWSADRKWFVFRYGCVAGRMARWDERYLATALFVAPWAEFERLAAANAGQPFDSWVPQCCHLLASNDEATPNKPR